ncbi:hypothetical protein HR060_13835 [Catenovulum sp. SM1970]|uniref:hypothetical protein n=1 Tax=Marinifaba aquimaris TaxID=2741323 RepID=UPI00157433E7|nr:hypothetical protein [Marinifaba aquimaris]NTS77934.1 hypothetical protein [Marinifaba aquimaris]
MLQVQYLIDDMKEIVEIDEDLEFIGIKHNHIHFMSQNDAEVESNHLHAANLFEQSNVIHAGKLGLVSGISIGVLSSIFLFFYQPFGWRPEFYNFVLVTLLLSGFTTWLGGLIGISQKNYKIEKFQQYLNTGKALMMVYLRPADMQKVLLMMSKKHPNAQYLATNSALDIRLA